MIQYHVKPLHEMKNTEVYQTLSLRQEIFVVEQDCPYLDADNKDFHGYQIYATSENQIIACSRLLPKGTSYKDYVSIGRICCKKEFRGTDVARKIIELSIEKATKEYGNIPIKISAQAPLTNYYEKFGFVSHGNQYLEDNIPHQAMIRITP